VYAGDGCRDAQPETATAGQTPRIIASKKKSSGIEQIRQLIRHGLGFCQMKLAEGFPLPVRRLEWDS
jgi:hypothetical protein